MLGQFQLNAKTALGVNITEGYSLTDRLVRMSGVTAVHLSVLEYQHQAAWRCILSVQLLAAGAVLVNSLCLTESHQVNARQAAVLQTLIGQTGLAQHGSPSLQNNLTSFW